MSPCLALHPSVLLPGGAAGSAIPTVFFSAATSDLKFQPVSSSGSSLQVWKPSLISGPLGAVGLPVGCLSPKGQVLGVDSASWLLLTEPLGRGHGSGFVGVSRHRTPSLTGPGPQCAMGEPQPFNDLTPSRLFYCSIWLKGPRETPQLL